MWFNAWPTQRERAVMATWLIAGPGRATCGSQQCAWAVGKSRGRELSQLQQPHSHGITGSLGVSEPC